jgi:methyltransferase family protein
VIVPPLLCEHPPEAATLTSFRLVCGVCESFWDLESRAAKVVYDEHYPTKRGHFDARIGALKVRSLTHWLRASGAHLEGKHVCEVGFGGGSCLALLAQRARKVSAIETNASAIDRVRESGSTAELLLVATLPARLAERVDLWLFQDSFEHILDPASFVDWMVLNSAGRAEILVVLPRGDSMSQRLMGRFWPHKLPDHEFHWSRAGLIEFLGRRGFDLVTSFFPIKFASPQMVLAHLVHKAGGSDRTPQWLSGTGLTFPLNFGEMGLLLKRNR